MDAQKILHKPRKHHRGAPSRDGAVSGAALEAEPDLSEEANEPEPGAGELPPEAERIGLKMEKEFDEEDDFADGRSSGGIKTRAEEDEWGRGTDPDERPFEESDVPPRGENA